MKLPIAKANEIDTPLSGFGFAFIDADDKKLKIKKHDIIVEYSNSLDNVQLLDLMDYTAFEVYPTSKNLEIGEYEQDGFTNAQMILAKSSHTMTIISKHSPDQQNVIIDWGDGTCNSLSMFENPEKFDDIYYKYRFVHEYAELDKKYIVKIFGNLYFSIMADNDANFTNIQNNIISRVFDKDLPIASNVTSLNSFCKGANRLLNINVANTSTIKNINDWSNCFYGCSNLKNILGLNTLNNANLCSQMFRGLTELEKTDFRLPIMPITSDSLSAIFLDNKKLTCDVNDLLPENGFYATKLNVDRLFKNSKVIISFNNFEDVSSKLWNNKNIKWSNTSECFSGCSDSTRSFVPLSWGGTDEDNKIKKSLEEQIEEINEVYKNLEYRVSILENS